jgi:thiamine biosynthesis lipoprotein
MMALERREFRVMGSDATVVVMGGPPGAADEARRRLDHLEALWSRFRPDSEISRLNEAGGAPVAVTPETLHLVERALEAWRLTGGSYDPTVLGDVLRAGYTVTFESLPALPDSSALARTTLRIGAGGIRTDPMAGTVQLPRGVGFDPGGIGKGLAADLAVEELLAAGAEGACVNVGGDLRVAGRGPAADPDDPSPDAGWVIGVEDPLGGGTAPLLGVGNGGIATTSRLRRRWTGPDGRPAHHLVNPRTGRPADTGLAAVTVVASEAWRAEVLTKAVFLAGPAGGAALLDDLGAAGLLITDDGSVVPTMNLASFLIPGGASPTPLEEAR